MENPNRLLLGEILIERKFITKEQLLHGLEVQRKENGFVGEILVKLGYLEERDIVVALVVQCGLPYIAINKYTLDPQAVALIPEDVARRERIIALDRIGDVLSVVMTNPLSVDKKEMIENLTKCRVATFIATKTEIDQAIEQNYPKS